MASSYNLSCPNCGRTIILEEELQEATCPYCGTKFSISQSRSSGRADSVTLYEATQVVNDIVRRISTYQKECMELYQSTHKNISNPFKRLLAGTDAFAISEIHERYFTALDKLVKELDGHLSSIHEINVKSDLAKKAVDSMLAIPEEKLPFQIVLNYSADDALAAPLIKHLSKEDLQSVYDAFTVPERRKQFYPNQKKLAEQMESMLGMKPKKGLAALFGTRTK